MASDVSIAQFRFLERLLLVHGHWCYRRIASMVINFKFPFFQVYHMAEKIPNQFPLTACIILILSLNFSLIVQFVN